MSQSFCKGIILVWIIGFCVFGATRTYRALTSPKPPVELSSTAIDPFERQDGDCKSFEGGFQDGYGLPGVPNLYISSGMQERDTFWLSRMKSSPWTYSCFLYAAVNGDPRALMPLYIEHLGMDRNYFDPFLLAPQSPAEIEAEKEQLTAFWKKWVIAFWGEAYFYREMGKRQFPGESFFDDSSVDYKMKNSDPLLRKAMDLGDAEAYFYYGLARYEVSEDNERATWQKGWPFLLKAADLGYIDAMLRVGYHLVMGGRRNKASLKSKDKESCLRGLRYLEAAAEQRSLEGMLSLEAIYFKGNTACTQEDLQKSAMYHLARRILRGGKLDSDTLRPQREMGLTEEQAAHALVAAAAYVKALPPDTKAEKVAEQRKRWAEMVPRLKQEINEQAPWIKWALVPETIRNKDRARAMNATKQQNTPQ